MNNVNYNKFIAIDGQIVDTSTPIVMAIINITPDSFFNKSRQTTKDGIKRAAEIAIRDGASILDIGGYSTRPGAYEISEQEETDRISMALDVIRNEWKEIPISIDTFRGNVARIAVKEFGANIINDISGYELDDQMLPAIIELQVPYILMHSKGNPQTMQTMTQYDDFISDILQYFAKKISILRNSGFNKEIIIDPGYGFAKTIEQNYQLLQFLPAFECFNSPLLVGISRKSMIFKPLEITPSEALNGTTALNTIALEKGANILRVHDVKEAMETIKLHKLLNATKYENNISTTRNHMGR